MPAFTSVENARIQSLRSTVGEEDDARSYSVICAEVYSLRTSLFFFFLEGILWASSFIGHTLRGFATIGTPHFPAEKKAYGPFASRKVVPRLGGHGSIPSLAHLCDTRVRGEPSGPADAPSPFPVAPSSGTLVATAALLRVSTLPTQGFRLPARVTNTRAERPPSQPGERRNRKRRKASTLLPAPEDGQVVCFLAQHSTRRLRVRWSDGPPTSG